MGKTPGLGAESLVKGPQELKRSQIVMNKKIRVSAKKTVKIVRTRTRAYHLLLVGVLPLRSVWLIVEKLTQWQRQLHTIVSTIVYIYLLHE